jgi:hypothetical protein
MGSIIPGGRVRGSMRGAAAAAAEEEDVAEEKFGVAEEPELGEEEVVEVGGRRGTTMISCR